LTGLHRGLDWRRRRGQGHRAWAGRWLQALDAQHPHRGRCDLVSQWARR